MKFTVHGIVRVTKEIVAKDRYAAVRKFEKMVRHVKANLVECINGDWEVYRRCDGCGNVIFDNDGLVTSKDASLCFKCAGKEG